MKCFCGCGRKVPPLSVGMRAINRRGRRVAKDVARIEGLLRTGLRSPNAEAFVEDGRRLAEELAEAVHTRTDPGLEVEAESREFMRRARERFTVGRIGRATRGMSAGEAAAAMASGGFDPFTDAEESPRELATWDVCLLVPSDVAAAADLVPNSNGDCLSWWLVDGESERDAASEAREAAAEEIGGRPDSYALVSVEPVDPMNARSMAPDDLSAAIDDVLELRRRGVSLEDIEAMGKSQRTEAEKLEAEQRRLEAHRAARGVKKRRGAK
jgi:hypothetical protein